MEEIWGKIEGFLGYQVSNRGRVCSYWKRKHRPTGYGCDWVLGDERHIMKLSDDGDGYLKVMLTDHSTGKRCCRKVHKLVAEAFIPHDPKDDTVDHIRSGPKGKLNNSVGNLRWIPRPDNIKKAYRDGMCDKRIAAQRKPIFVIDIHTGDEAYFSSIQDAADTLGIDRSSISHVLIGDHKRTSHYTFEYADEIDTRTNGGVSDDRNH